jgi:hypothetical protein
MIMSVEQSVECLADWSDLIQKVQFSPACPLQWWALGFNDTAEYAFYYSLACQLEHSSLQPRSTNEMGAAP